VQGLTREQWAEKLALIGAFIKAKGAKITIEIIGSWPAIELGMPGRTSEDLDVWMPNSRFDRALFREACLNAGVDFDPTGEVDRPYIQLVRPGITQVPRHEPEHSAVFGGLILVTPPPAALIASKLVRASGKDMHDIVFLKQKFRIPMDDIMACVKAIGDKMARETAEENIVYLEFRASASKRKSKAGGKRNAKENKPNAP